MLILGEAGIGKSSLLTALADEVTADGGTAQVGRAIPGGGTYRAFSSALAPLLRALPADPPAELLPYRTALGRLAPAWSNGGTTGDSGAP